MDLGRLRSSKIRSAKTGVPHLTTPARGARLELGKRDVTQRKLKKAPAVRKTTKGKALNMAYKGLLAAIVPMVAALPAAAATNDNLLQAAAPWAAIVLGSLAYSLVAPQPKNSQQHQEVEDSLVSFDKEEEIPVESPQPLASSPVVYEESALPVGAMALVEEEENAVPANGEERNVETVLHTESEPKEMLITVSKEEASADLPAVSLMREDLHEPSKEPSKELETVESPASPPAVASVLSAKDSTIDLAVPEPVKPEAKEPLPALAMADTASTAAIADAPVQSESSIQSPAHTRSNEELSVRESPVAVMATTGSEEGPAGDKQAANKKKQYEARVTTLKQTAAQKEARAQKEAEEQRLWEARRAKAQKLYSAAQAKATERTVKEQTKVMPAVSPVHHLVKFTPKALLATILEQFAGIWKWMRASMSALFKQKPTPKHHYT